MTYTDEYTYYHRTDCGVYQPVLITNYYFKGYGYKTLDIECYFLVNDGAILITGFLSDEKYEGYAIGVDSGLTISSFALDATAPRYHRPETFIDIDEKPQSDRLRIIQTSKNGIKIHYWNFMHDKMELYHCIDVKHKLLIAKLKFDILVMSSSINRELVQCYSYDLKSKKQFWVIDIIRNEHEIEHDLIGDDWSMHHNMIIMGQNVFVIVDKRLIVIDIKSGLQIMEINIGMQDFPFGVPFQKCSGMRFFGTRLGLWGGHSSVKFFVQLCGINKVELLHNIKARLESHFHYGVDVHIDKHDRGLQVYDSWTRTLIHHPIHHWLGNEVVIRTEYGWFKLNKETFKLTELKWVQKEF